MRAKVIINSKAGNGRSKRIGDFAREVLGAACDSVAYTCFANHATLISREACQSGCDTMVVVGGDGTVNEVVNGTIGYDVAIGIIPFGTANDLARYHHIPSDPILACRVILANYRRTLDLISVNGWHYLTVAGLGLPCKAVEKTDQLRSRNATSKALVNFVGSRIYLLALAIVYRRATRQGIGLQIKTGQKSWSGNAFSVIIANQPTLGQSFCVSPAASDDDGYLDLFAITDTHNSRQLLQTVLATVTGTTENSANVLRLQTDSLVIDTSKPTRIFADGELRDSNTHFDFQVVPHAVTLIVPRSRGGEDV